MATTETDVNREPDLGPLADANDREPQAIERDIDATRADMRATLEEIERRFSFERLLDLAVGRIRERGGEFANNLTEAATQNPMPVLLTSIGLAWMMMSSTRRGPRAYSATHDTMQRARGRVSDAADTMRSAAERMRGAADSTRDTLHHAADSSREALRNATQSSRETFEHTTESLRHTAESLRSGATRAAAATRDQVDHARARMDRMLEEQPLMLGVFGLAAGALIGALLPATEHENRMLGEVRDKALNEAKREGRSRLEAVGERLMAAASPSSGGEDEERPTSRPH